jgi:anaerobic selenocysteine-containing dehydrogenase
MAAASNVSEWLAWALNAVTGSLDRRGGIMFNPGFLRPQETGLDGRPRFSGPSAQSRPELRHSFGELPCVALADEILSGRVKALVVLGGNPIKVFPDANKIRSALQSLEVLATIEVRNTETTELSTHVLPCAGQLERTDLPGFIDTAFPIPFTQYGARVVAPAAQRRPTWWILSQLGERMGLRMPDVPQDGNEDTLLARGVRRSRVPFDELRQFPSGVIATDAPDPGWLIPSSLPHGSLDLAPPEFVEQLKSWEREAVVDDGFRLVNRRLPHQMNSQLREIPSQQRPPAPTLLVNRADAERLGLTDGATATVRSRHGETTATVEQSDSIRPGVVSLPHAWGAPDVNQLTSDVEDVDSLTGMPRFSGLDVTVQLLA